MAQNIRVRILTKLKDILLNEGNDNDVLFHGSDKWQLAAMQFSRATKFVGRTLRYTDEDW